MNHNQALMASESKVRRRNASTMDKEPGGAPPAKKTKPLPGMFDAGKVKVKRLEERVHLATEMDFLVDVKEVAVQREIEVFITTPTGQRSNVLTKTNDDGTCNCNYKTSELGPHTIDVICDGTSKRAFNFDVTMPCDPSRVRAYGAGLKGGWTNVCQLFTVDVAGAGKGDVKVIICGPTESEPNLKKRKDGSRTVEYLPTKPGDYEISITFANEDITGSPFHAIIKDKIDVQKVMCKGEGIGVNLKSVGEPCGFIVDATKAGQAELQVMTTNGKGNMEPATITNHGDGTYDVKYVPNRQGQMSVNVSYDGKPVPGSPFCTIITSVVVNGDGIKSEGVLASLPTSFSINSSEDDEVSLEVDIQDPQGNIVKPRVLYDGVKTYTVTYVPTEVGCYTVRVLRDKIDVPNSPFNVLTSITGDASKVKILPTWDSYPVGEQGLITADTSEAGLGNATCRIRTTGGRDVDVDVVRDFGGIVTFLYTPSFPGFYDIDLKFGGQPLLQGLRHLACKDYKRFRTKMLLKKLHRVDACLPLGPKSGFLSARMTSPSGKQLKPSFNGVNDLLVEIFRSSFEPGIHKLGIEYKGIPIQGSPFNVFAIGHTGVKVKGSGLVCGIVRNPCNFDIFARGLREGDLFLAVDGPDNIDISIINARDNMRTASYLPKIPGEYCITVKYLGIEVPGSPFTAKIISFDWNKNQKIHQSESQFDTKMLKQKALIKSEIEFGLRIPGISKCDLNVIATSPLGANYAADIEERQCSRFGFKFAFTEKGIHMVNIKSRGMDIPGSPLQYTIGPINVGGACKVRAIGPGLERGEVNNPNYFNIYTREAGKGELSLLMEGPSKVEIDVQDQRDGIYEVNYKCSEPGEFLMSVMFLGHHIPDSPFKVRVPPPSGDVGKLNIEGLEKSFEIGTETTFTVNLNGARGKLNARITAPSGDADWAVMQMINEDCYKVSFAPNENGCHNIEVTLDGNYTLSSPLKMIVGKHDICPELVNAYGDALYKGKSCEAGTFIVNTVKGSAGSLIVTIEGPLKVQMDYDEIEEGYEFTYLPWCSGDYRITIKYGGDYHIAGSPFLARIEGDMYYVPLPDHTQVILKTTKTSNDKIVQPTVMELMSDASKVKAVGAGLSEAFVNQEATFNVDLTLAGRDMLLVGLMGPEMQSEDVSIKHSGLYTKQVTYLVKKPGKYNLTVRYGAHDITGSPFPVTVQKPFLEREDC